MDELIDTQEVAELCRTSAETVRYWQYVGKAPRSFKLGRRRLYKRADVIEWLESKYQQTAVAR
ncbi:MAG: helix-turn-helix domain-containing protein [Propionibacteriaceae bacterium]|nr:helix-turn-helix domain-containing protein [Propionibacteriaceae bacterium]